MERTVVDLILCMLSVPFLAFCFVSVWCLRFANCWEDEMSAEYVVNCACLHLILNEFNSLSGVRSNWIFAENLLFLKQNALNV